MLSRNEMNLWSDRKYRVKQDQRIALELAGQIVKKLGFIR